MNDKKRVLDVGNCDPDHAALRRLVEGSFNAELVRAHGWDDAEKILGEEPFQLVIVNRKLDRDYTDGMNIITQIKAAPKLASVPVMLLTNYPEYQDEAVAAGAVRGFGKLEFNDPQTKVMLAEYLS